MWAWYIILLPITCGQLFWGLSVSSFDGACDMRFFYQTCKFRILTKNTKCSKMARPLALVPMYCYILHKFTSDISYCMSIIHEILQGHGHVKKKRKEKRNAKVFCPNMQCLFTTSLSCLHEHESVWPRDPRSVSSDALSLDGFEIYDCGLKIYYVL